MRMKIDEFTTNYFVCNFTEQEYLDMLTGVMPSETKEKIIDAFIRYLRDRKKISLPVLKGMITKFNRVLYDNAMRSVESYLFFDKNDEEAVKNYVKKLTFDDYADIVSDCLFRMKNRHIGKDYVYTTELKNLPYNIESLLNAASTIFDMIINMELQGDPPTFVTTTEKNFYKMTEGLSDEIIKRARLDAGIEIVGKLPVAISQANETTADACQPERSDEITCDRTFSTSHFRDKISLEKDEKNEITIDSDEE